MSPSQIKEIGFYVETNLSASMVVKLARQVISLFGYDENKLVFETQEKSSKESTASSKNEQYRSFFDRLRIKVVSIEPNFTRAKALPRSYITGMLVSGEVVLPYMLLQQMTESSMLESTSTSERGKTMKLRF